MLAPPDTTRSDRAGGDWLDARDQRAYANSTYSAFQDSQPGDTASWRNPDTRARGTTTIADRYVNDAGQPCKSLAHRIQGDQRTETTSGVARRTADGDWEVETVG